MKKQTTNNKLIFNKINVTELNKSQLSNIKGGTATLVGTTSTIMITLQKELI